MGLRQWITSRAAAAPPSPLSREAVAGAFLHGDGIEIGALQHPLALPPAARVRYVDRMTESELRRQYPELDGQPLAPVDLIDDGETLASITSASQDFVIANHFLEHCQDPIGTLENFLRVLRPGGVVFMAVPDKSCDFDRDRPDTTLEHLLRDHREGPAWSRRAHYEEWLRVGHKLTDPAWAEDRLSHYMSMDYSIHFHVWSPPALLKFFTALCEERAFPFDLEMFLHRPEECIVILRKTGKEERNGKTEADA